LRQWSIFERSGRFADFLEEFETLIVRNQPCKKWFGESILSKIEANLKVVKSRAREGQAVWKELKLRVMKIVGRRLNNRNEGRRMSERCIVGKETDGNQTG
jgi:hypothetical protein